ncbi:MAG TPA: asparagine synthase-related protein [Streptosporangiaceae bacterium]|nr:asparagine synthase-related protein [Streptosporangiaceae bacterium]
MLETHLPVANVCWSNATTAPARIDLDIAGQLTGRFATAFCDGRTIVLARDPLGINKLFFSYHPARGVVAANYLMDMVRAGIPFRDIYSVPAGSVVAVDLHRRTVATSRYYTLPATSGSAHPIEALLTEIASDLATGLQKLAAMYPDAPVAICLSGGADSALIALYATRQFPKAVAYTYSYEAGQPSEDATTAREVAQHLGLDLRLVPADSDMILQSLQRALTYGQDWRDFNVHAAIVNDILAAAIAADHRTSHRPPPIVLTGDLMNELLGDYSPVRFAGSTYYQLPHVSPSKLRIALTRGIQAGDREVGVFKARGLDVAQPYGWAFKRLLQFPDPVIKSKIIKGLAGPDLPDEMLSRPKVRAQIGDSEARSGILPQLVAAGFDNRWLEAAFCRAIGIPDARELRQFVRAGIYRPFPHASS